MVDVKTGDADISTKPLTIEDIAVKQERYITTKPATVEIADDRKKILGGACIDYIVINNARLNEEIAIDFEKLARRALIFGNYSRNRRYNSNVLEKLLAEPVLIPHGVEPIPELYVMVKHRKRLIGSGFLHREKPDESGKFDSENCYLLGVYVDRAYDSLGIELEILSRISAHARSIGIKKITAVVPRFPATQRFYAEQGFTVKESSVTRGLPYHNMQLQL